MLLHLTVSEIRWIFGIYDYEIHRHYVARKVHESKSWYLQNELLL